MGNDEPPQPPSHPNWTRYGQPSYRPPTPSAPAPKLPRQRYTGWFIGWFIVNGFIFLVVASSIGVLLLIGVLLITSNNINTGPPLGVPYYTPAPTATPTGPQSITGVTLGGIQDAFTAAFGDPVMTGSIPHYQFTLADGTQAGICFCGTSTGLDGQQHLEFMKVGPGPNVTWTLATKNTVVKRFMPPDAVYVRTIQDPDVGPILVYTSADLAKTFPASEFTDSAGGPNPPAGTFSVTCQQPGIADCSVTTGT